MSKTGCTSVSDWLMTRRISAVAACCSWASALSLRASARRVSRTRPSSLGDLWTTGGLASLDFAGFGPRLISLSLPLMKWPGTGYGERDRRGKWAAYRGLPRSHPSVASRGHVIAGLWVVIVGEVGWIPHSLFLYWLSRLKCMGDSPEPGHLSHLPNPAWTGEPACQAVC